MSAVGGSLPFYKLVTKTSTVTEAAATTSTSTVFNTNIPFGKAMNIRVLRPVIALKTAPVLAANTVDQILWELTEDPTKTVVAQTDPFGLSSGGKEIISSTTTAVGSTIVYDGLFIDVQSFVVPHPGVPSVAQQMNLVATAIRVTGGNVYTWDVFLELYYELIDLSQNLRTFLSNRIALQRTT